MREKKALHRRLLRPHALITLFVALTATVLEALCLSGRIQNEAVAYFSYLYSTYAMVIVCLALYDAIKNGKGRAPDMIDGFISAHPRLMPYRRFIDDPEFRRYCLLWPALALNLLFAVFKLITGLYYRSLWFIGLSVYYALLSWMRFSLIRTLGPHITTPNSRACAALLRKTGLRLLALTGVMAGLVIQMVLDRRAYHYHGVLIYVFALYAFIKIGTAATALFRKPKDENPLLLAARYLSFVCAMVSILALQTALIDRFGGDDIAFGRIANGATGLCVCAALLGLSASLLIRARRIRKRAI